VAVMRTMLVTLRIALAVVWALARRVLHRVFHGALVPSWSWTVELRLVLLKTFLDAARNDPDPQARRLLEERVDPPLLRRLRGVMSFEKVQLAGMDAEHHEPIAIGLGTEPVVTMLYLHGGAYLAGSAATHRRWISNLSWSLGAEAFAPDYRLAPQHRFPAALDDAMATYRELLARGVDPRRLFVAGDSAGGGLATALLLRLRDEKEPLPAGAILFSPYTDLEHTGASIMENHVTDYLPFGEPEPNTWYLGDHDPKDPYASPMYGDFTGIPPLLVFAGGREMIRDDSTRLVEAAVGGGCKAVLHLAPDMFHVWPALLPNHPETMRALAIAADFVRTSQR
jgi:monoterpene epsilon-lactone hydrolase